MFESSVKTMLFLVLIFLVLIRHPCVLIVRAVYKSGTGTSGSVCGDLGLGDARRGTMGRVGQGRGDVKYMDAGDAGCE